MSDDAIRHAVNGGRWQRVHRGIYATFSGELRPRHVIRAGLLIAGAGAQVTGGATCLAYGMKYVPRGPTVILVPNRVRKVPPRSVVFLRVRSLPQPRTVRSFPCAPPARAAIDACANLRDARSTRALLCEAVQRGLATAEQLVTAFGDVRSTNPHVRATLDDVAIGCRSGPECEGRATSSEPARFSRSRRGINR